MCASQMVGAEEPFDRRAQPPLLSSAARTARCCSRALLSDDATGPPAPRYTLSCVRPRSVCVLTMEALAAAAAAAAPAAALPADAAVAITRPQRRLSVEQRWAIIALWKDGQTRETIARKLDVNKEAVTRWTAHYRATGGVDDTKRRGRPRATDEALDTAIAFTARVDIFTSPRQIKRKLELDVSSRTVDRRLQEAGLFGRVARHKRAYSDAERQKRLSFSNGYKDWTKQQWEKVLFSDEKCFYGAGFCGRVWVRRERGEALNPKYCVSKIAHPVKVNVWACFCAAGVGYSHIFNENMDAALLKQILKDNLLPSARLHFRADPPEQWFLLHDNDKKFTSNAVKQQLHNDGVTTIDFPPYSPDLNPIENLWSTMQREVEKHTCDTMDKMQDVIADEWAKVDQQLMQKLAHSMPQRCAAVIEADGWHTKY
jgi:transposase